MATNAVIDGFRSDIKMLLNRFVKQNSTTFDCFCNEWKRMSFQYTFHGYLCLSEMAQFLEDVFLVVKQVLLEVTKLEEQIGALYLMYAMYFKQPPKQYCKFRMTMSEWKKMNQIYNKVCISHQQSCLVFWKLLQAHAFRKYNIPETTPKSHILLLNLTYNVYKFVEAEHEYGFERFMQKPVNKVDDENNFQKINPILESTINMMQHRTTGIMTGLKILQMGYNEMKEHLDPMSTLSTTNITADISSSLNNIEKIFKLNNECDADVEATNDAADSGDNKHSMAVRTAKLKHRAAAFGDLSKEPTANSNSKKKTTLKYRTSVSDDGDFIKIQKASPNKTKKTHLNERQVKTVVKQLDIAFDGESELVGNSSTIKEEKQCSTKKTAKSLPSISTEELS